jgi:hypothetical protein
MRRNAMKGIEAKVEILNLIWGREVNQMSMAAIKSKDKKQRALVADLSMINPDHKIAVLKSYLFMCSIRHSLAFFQWRDTYHPESNVSLQLKMLLVTKSLFDSRKKPCLSCFRAIRGTSSGRPTFQTPLIHSSRSSKQVGSRTHMWLGRRRSRQRLKS